MAKRADVVRLLKKAGYESVGGAKHEKFRNAQGMTALVPRHGELNKLTAKRILEGAGIPTDGVSW